MNTNLDPGKATLADAQRIARLALAQGGRYRDELWALVESAPDERVRGFAYTQATRPATV